MTQSILYISYTGLMDALGQSQVLQYVLALAKSGHRMTVLSFEKPESLSRQDRVAAIQALCNEAGVDWRPRKWHNKPIGMVATLYDLVVGRMQAIRIAREVGAEIVHCRSYIASLMGLAVKDATGAKFVFDMRGFWPDERVDGEIWSKSSVTYRVFKHVERRLFLNADHIVSLTKAGVREYEAFDYMMGKEPKSTVIPTCTNLDMFRLQDTPREGFTLGYVGSVGSWYLFDEVARAVARTFALRPDARFLVVTKGNHDLVRKALDKAGADLERIEVRSADFSEVAQQIGRMDAGVFFIRPAWSKRASCPTRMGEFLACGKPCLANGGVGDVAEDIEQTGTGIALPPLGTGNVDLTNLDKALETLFKMAADPAMQVRCRAVAEERFSLTRGVAAYSGIYQQLAGRPA
jgi:glycosyltransferase involved in cell wall biosynthesis